MCELWPGQNRGHVRCGRAHRRLNWRPASARGRRIGRPQEPSSRGRRSAGSFGNHMQRGCLAYGTERRYPMPRSFTPKSGALFLARLSAVTFARGAFRRTRLIFDDPVIRKSIDESDPREIARTFPRSWSAGIANNLEAINTSFSALPDSRSGYGRTARRGLIPAALPHSRKKTTPHRKSSAVGATLASGFSSNLRTSMVLDFVLACKRGVSLYFVVGAIQIGIRFAVRELIILNILQLCAGLRRRSLSLGAHRQDDFHRTAPESAATAGKEAGQDNNRAHVAGNPAKPSPGLFARQEIPSCGSNARQRTDVP